jgi:hypothetical protein
LEASPSTAGTSATTTSEPNSPKSAAVQDQSHHTMQTQASQIWDSPRFSHAPPLLPTSQPLYGHSVPLHNLVPSMTQLHSPILHGYVDGDSERDPHGQHAHPPQLLQHHSMMSSHPLDSSHEMHGHFNNYYGYPNPGSFDPALMPPMTSNHLNNLSTGSSPPSSSSSLPIASQDSFRQTLTGGHHLSMSPPSSGSSSFYSDMDMFPFGASHTGSDEYFHWSPSADS